MNTHNRHKFMNIPSLEQTYARFVERFPIAVRHGWTLEQTYPTEHEKDDYKYAHLYQIVPPRNSPIIHWATHYPRHVVWAGIDIDIPQTFWDDDLIMNHGR